MLSKGIVIVLIYLNLMGLDSIPLENQTDSSVNFNSKITIDSNMECKCNVKNCEHEKGIKTQYTLLSTKTIRLDGQIEYT